MSPSPAGRIQDMAALHEGLRVRNLKTIQLKSQRNQDWEPFHQNGVMRNIHTNELKARKDIPDLVIRGEEFGPGALIGVVEYQDELDGTWKVQWHHPKGYPLSSSMIEGSTCYVAGEVDPVL